MHFVESSVINEMIGPTNYRAKRCIICVHKSAKSLWRADFHFSNDMFSRKVTK